MRGSGSPHSGEEVTGVPQGARGEEHARLDSRGDLGHRDFSCLYGDVVTYTISLTHLKRDTSDLRLAVSERSEPGSRGAWDKGWGQYA